MNETANNEGDATGSPGVPTSGSGVPTSSAGVSLATRTGGTPQANFEARTEPVAEPSEGKQSRAYDSVRKQFIAVVCAQILLLAGFAAPKAYTLATGQVLTLQAEPVDPYDLFRGEYASLRYKELSLVNGSRDFYTGDKAYVLLTKQGNEWKATSISKEKPRPLANQIVIAGKVDGAPYPQYQTNQVVVPMNYGIEHLYTPQGKSAELQNNAAQLSIDVSVDSEGNACIKRVVLKGHEIYDGLSMLNPFS